MVLFLQCISVIFIYTIIVLAKCKDPVQFYSDYPPKIKERIKALPMYKDKIPTSEKTYGVKIMGYYLFSFSA
ncbi:hypothetical protein [Clostridium felsineum]|uniref:hypothetical protein n=1 Tax=Clostridium felsineum TaxID=36839 RepID=UPI00098CA302|nr:hypothetical protein [Clostridium felsineum]URZ18761.1 hypothetical protein CLFE_048490 [Clostridium felsineum DSM 794]